MRRRFVSFLILAAAIVSACSKKPETRPLDETPPPIAQSSKPVAVGKKRYLVATEGKVSVVIDAPKEKFRGDTAKLSGVLDVDVSDLGASTGEIVADLDAFVTHTFEDADDNQTQTEHAKNWFEIGEKVPKDKRDDYRMARFVIETVVATSAKSVAAAPEQGGTRTVHLTATGSLRVHGRSEKKTVEVDVSFKGPPDAPTEIAFRTTQPVIASLSAHDVKPRDAVGRFLAGTLEKVGKKIDDRAQVQVEGRAVPKA